jgi:hypothetical protein
MVHRVEETFQVDANRIAVTIPYYLRDAYQCLLRSSPRAETETSFTELAFIDGG